MKKGWRGYNFSRAIDGQMIPQRVQNLVIRDYCRRQGIDYLLSATEYSMENAAMILHSVYEELRVLKGSFFTPSICFPVLLRNANASMKWS